MTARFSHLALSLELPSNFEYDEATDIGLNVVMTPRQVPDVPTDTIAGSGLWRVAIFGNVHENGSHETRFDEQTQVLSHAEQGATLSPEGMLEFDLTKSFRIGRVGCDGLPYFCVEFSKGDSPVPDFILADPVVGCVELPCTCKYLSVAFLFPEDEQSKLFETSRPHAALFRDNTNTKDINTWLYPQVSCTIYL